MGFRTTWRILCLAAAAITMLVLAVMTSVWFPGPEVTNAQSGAIGNSASPSSLPPQLSSIIPSKPTSVPQPPVLSSLPGTTPAVATIEPSPGVTTSVAIPGVQGSQGSVNIPNNAGGDTPLQVTVRAVVNPTNAPAGLTVISAVQIAFTSLTDSSSIRTLNEEVTIEISYASLNLGADQLDRLVIYNASRDEYLPTTIDTDRKVAIARTNRFSTFTLARITGPIPRGYVPLAAKEYMPGW